MKFKLIGKDKETKARAGEIITDNGIIETPIFMPVGTLGAVKAVHTRELLNDIKAQIILGNTYHLYLRPGLDILKQAGGLHKFSGWSKPLLTDSGGFQIYSLSQIRKITEEGVTFNSHIDGSPHYFTPEKAIDIQRIIGADIIMAFDECTPYPCEYNYAKKSLSITHKWLDRCLKHFKNTESLYAHSQSLFPIVQGSVYKDLRMQSADFCAEKDVDGIAIGGLSVGEPIDIMYEMTGLVCDRLPENKPRYLMGVGMPANIIEAISLGIDMFDCVIPTRNGRNGMLLTKEGIINIKNEKWKNDFSSLDENNYTYVDLQYSKAFLRQLFSCEEILASMIASIHNLGFYLWLVKEARQQIINGNFGKWKDYILPKLEFRL